MKSILILATLFTLGTQARVIVSDRANAQVNIAKVVSVTNLVNDPGIMVNVSVYDFGGSKDMYNSQKIYFNLYSKGEIASTDASFQITEAESVEAVRRISDGIFEIDVREYNDIRRIVTYRINAIEAIQDIKSIICFAEFECVASNHFAAAINVTRR